MYTLRERLAYVGDSSTAESTYRTPAQATVALWGTALTHYVTEPYRDIQRLWMRNIGHRGVKVGKSITYHNNDCLVTDIGINIQNRKYVTLLGIRKNGTKFITPKIAFENLEAAGLVKPRMFSKEIHLVKQLAADTKFPSVSSASRMALLGAATLATCSATPLNQHEPRGEFFGFARPSAELNIRDAQPLPLTREMYLNADEITIPTALRPDGRNYSSWDEYFARNPFTPAPEKRYTEVTLEDRSRGLVIGGVEEEFAVEPQVDEQYLDRGF